jgi:phage-related protein
MPGIGRGISEIRIPERGGAYRVFYMIQSELGILLFHAFQKKGRQTPEREKSIARRRLGALLKELGVKN